MTPELIAELTALLEKSFGRPVTVEQEANPCDDADGPLLLIDRRMFGLWVGSFEFPTVPTITRPASNEVKKGFMVEEYVHVSNWPHEPDDTDVVNEIPYERFEGAVGDLVSRIALSAVRDHFERKAESAFAEELDAWEEYADGR